MKNKFLLALIIITISIIAIGTVSVSAEREGIYSYYVSGGNATITECNTSTSGEITISKTLGGYPVTSIGNDAFNSCNKLTSITIPDSITSIGTYAFYYCTELTSINIPDSVTSIGDAAFYACKGLTSITMPDSVTSIGEWTFYACRGLTSITIPDSVTSIGYSAFYDCTGLTSITIPDSVTSIREEAFYDCTGLKSITIPDSVESIGDGAFRNCTGLTSITIGNSVTSIGGSAFYNCTGLTSVTIPDNVTSIGNDAFSYCTSLTSVTIGQGIESIPENCFNSCSNLKYVGLSENIKYIGNDAFNSCSNISTVFYEGSESDWNEILIYNRNENLTNAKTVYNATRKTYRFETNCNEKLNDITDYAIYTSPTVKNEGKNFLGWYDNSSLSGEPVTFPYYGSTTTLYAAWATNTGKTFDDAITAKENKRYTVTTTESGQIIYYKFVPNYTGKYRFYSTGRYDTYGYLYNSNRNQITCNDDSGEENNFYIERELTAGETYYIGAKIYSGTGSFTLHIDTECMPGTKTVCVTASSGEKIFITLPNYIPENNQIILTCYKNGNFVEMESAPNKNETIYFVINNDFDNAKVMVWESFENLKPLCEVEIVK